MGAVRTQAQIKALQSQQARIVRGTVVAVNPLRLAGSDGDEVEVPALGWYAPVIGDEVQVLRSEGSALVLGPTYASGALAASRIIQTEPSITASLPNPYIVTASQIATWRGGWRRDTTAAYQGDWTGSGDNSGYWFYSQPKLERLQGLAISKAEVFMHAASGGSFGATTAKMFRHSAAKRGGSQPALSLPWDGPALADGASGWGLLPSAVSAALIASGGGLAVSSSGRTYYTSFRPLGTRAGDARSGSIRFYWRQA